MWVPSSTSASMVIQSEDEDIEDRNVGAGDVVSRQRSRDRASPTLLDVVVGNHRQKKHHHDVQFRRGRRSRSAAAATSLGSRQRERDGSVPPPAATSLGSRHRERDRIEGGNPPISPTLFVVRGAVWCPHSGANWVLGELRPFQSQKSQSSHVCVCVCVCVLALFGIPRDRVVLRSTIIQHSCSGAHPY